MEELDYLSAKLLAESIYCIFLHSKSLRIKGRMMLFLDAANCIIFSLTCVQAGLVLSAIEVVGANGKYQDLAFYLQVLLDTASVENV